MSMKLLLFRAFDRTIGQILRASEASLKNPRPNLIDLVYEDSMKTSLDYVKEYLSGVFICSSRESLWDYCCEYLSKSPSKLVVMEFGVHSGESINYIAKKLPNAEVFGFDSFLGLQENWFISSAKAGALNLDGTAPKVQKNVRLFTGWFDETLPKFISNYPDLKINFLHIDSDTYLPAKLILSSLESNIIKGTIIVFDEFFGYPNWQWHEFKAFEEFTKKHNLKYQAICYSSNQVAFEIK